MAKKEVAFKIRIEESLRRDFLAACQARDLSAAHVVRAYMREYVARHESSRQRDLFNGNDDDDV